MTTHYERCIAKINEKLEPHNGKVATAILLSKDMGRMYSRTIIGTEKIDTRKRKPVPTLTAAFCPFCGVSMTAEDEAEQAASGRADGGRS